MRDKYTIIIFQVILFILMFIFNKKGFVIIMKFSKKSLAIFLTVSILGSWFNVSAMKSRSDTHYVSEIFVNEPWNYGLRGDPGLWNALSEVFYK